ncbi:Nicotinate-nucleotide adenylyltransferase [bioreactor metagenome]|uniref:Nicotinate-nucleotide adenylyltransferase n=1 Tax=bioreactor metagenome TaxID=1076179 RepID=A0A644WZG7_9ZZZZ
MLGGTFNPPHSAHVAMARYALEHLQFDEVIIMPTATPPHKQAGEVAPEHRLQMARLAFTGIQGIVVSDLEQRRGGKSYTIDTITEIGPVSLLMGEDMFVTIESWHRAGELIRSTELVVFPRPGYQDGVEIVAQRLREQYGARILVTDMPLHPDSSTEVRASIARGCRPNGVPETVMSYIEEMGLYVSH